MNEAHRGSVSRSGGGWVVMLSLLCCSLSGLALGQTNPAPFAQPEPKHILFLYSYGYGSKGVEVFNETFRNTLANAGVSVTSIYSEFLDLERNKADPDYRPRLLDMLRRKYVDKHIDLVVTGQQPALNFLLNEGQELAPAVPAIATLAPVPTAVEAGKRWIVSHSSSFDMKGTLERAMEVFPNTQRIVFASGSSDADRKLAVAAADSGSALKGKVNFEFTHELSLDDMLKRLGSLPPRTIIVFTQFNRDIAGRVGVAYEVERMIIKAANAPVFGFYDFNLYNGGIGGSVFGVSKLGESTANLVLGLLNGKLKLDQQITVVKSDPFPMFDWVQIKRWGGDPSTLPANTVFVNRVPTFWEEYRIYILGVILFVIAQSLLIVALLVNRRRRAAAEQQLRYSQKTTQDVIDGIPSLIYGLDPDGRFTFANKAFYKLFRIDPEHLLHHTRETLSMPKQLVDDHRSHDITVMRTGKPIEVEEHNIEEDGDHFYLTQKFPLREPDGAIGGVFGMSTDITELKQSHMLTDSLLKTIPFPMDIVDYQGTVLYMSEKMQQTLGKAGLGERCWNLYKDDSAQCDHCPLPQGIQVGRTAAIESVGVFGGRVFEIRHTGMIYKGRDAILEIFLDITERKQAEEALEKVASELREAQQVAQLGSWHWDSVHDVIWWSDQLFAIYDRPPGLAPPSYEEDQKNYTPESAAKLTDVVQRALETGEPYEVDLELSKDTSPTRWVVAKGEVRRDGEGKIVGLRGTVQDVTERKQLELALMHGKADLQQLYRSIESLREEDRRKIARELHDDLGHRLTTLNMDLDRLDSKLRGAGAEVESRIAAIGDEVMEIVDAVRRICEDLRPGMLDALGLPAAIEGHVTTFAARTGIPCKLVMSHDDFAVNGNVAINIFRIVQEALNNAMKYAKASKILVTLQFSQHEITLAVEDDGIGMAKQTKDGRIGFGLLGMRERVTTLNGQLSVTSEPGRGMRIEVVIPT